MPTLAAVLIFLLFGATLFTDIWTQIHGAIEEGLYWEKRSDEAPVMSNWRAYPGNQHRDTDFDGLYPHVFTHAMPAVYLNYDVPDSGQAGGRVRDALLGVLALADENLLVNHNLEVSPKTLTLSGPATWGVVGIGSTGFAKSGLGSIRANAGSVIEARRVAVEPGEELIGAVTVMRTGGPARACVQIEWTDLMGSPVGQTAQQCGGVHDYETWLRRKQSNRRI